jgi:hypothetical protein
MSKIRVRACGQDEPGDQNERGDKKTDCGTHSALQSVSFSANCEAGICYGLWRHG